MANMWPGSYRRPLNWNASAATGAAALIVLMQVMRRRRNDRDLGQLAVQGGMGAVATMVYQVMNNDLQDSQGFWDTAQWLLATYGAYEAYQLVLFNIDAITIGGLSGAGPGHPDPMDYDEYVRPRSRLAMSAALFTDAGTSAPGWLGPFGISGAAELKPLLYVMSAALLFERLKLRQTLNKTPLAILGLYALTKEKPATRRLG